MTQEITLVTGADGLVGNALRSKCINLKNYYFVNRKECDLTVEEEVDNLFKKIKPKNIIHLAAVVGGVKSNTLYPADFFSNNIKINLNIYNCSVKWRVKKLAVFMSTCVFPNNAYYPLSSEQLHLGPPHESNFGYAYAKRMLEVQSRAYFKQYGLSSIVLIPTNIYGPHDNFDTENGHVLPSLINKIFNAKKNNGNLKVWGTGDPLREFVYSKDIANLIIWLLGNYHDAEPLILSSNIEISIRDLVLMLSRKMNFQGLIEYDISQPDGQYRKPSSNARLNSICPDFKWTLLDDGIGETVSWFLNNLNVAKGFKSNG